jgi:glycyl-tRNA synthetase
VPDKERAFYSKGTYDIEYDFPFGRQELEGVAYRTDYDLSQHQKASGKSLEYFDEEAKQKFIPHVVEPSAGVDRTVLALICEAYTEDEAPDEKGKMETRTVLRFHPRMAPIKCAVFPLLKNKEELVAKAKAIIDLLRPHMYVFYDEGGAIGRRYRRQDEIGTPFCITVDFETLGEKDAALRDTVTLRHRDSMKQERVKISELTQLLSARIA